jgi:hypothetical protein
MVIGGVAFFWHWHDPRVLIDLNGINVLYFLLVLSLTPLVTANGYFGGMVTFPLEEEASLTEKGQLRGWKTTRTDREAREPRKG